jgi:hypothetical protein
VLVWYHQTIELALAIHLRFCSTSSVCGWSNSGQSRSADYILHFTAPSLLTNRAATLNRPLGLAGTTPYLQTIPLPRPWSCDSQLRQEDNFRITCGASLTLILPRLHLESLSISLIRCYQVYFDAPSSFQQQHATNPNKRTSDDTFNFHKFITRGSSSFKKRKGTSMRQVTHLRMTG